MKFISITPKNVSDYVTIVEKQRMPAFIKLYSPDCGHCIAMQSDWNQLKNNDDLKKLNIAIIEVRNDALGKITHPTTANVSGFPTMRLVVNGKIKKEYDGGRMTNDMVNFIKENFGNVQKGGYKRSKSKRSKSKSIRRKRKSRKSIRTRSIRSSRRSIRINRK
jgi:hypothetical protein